MLQLAVVKPDLMLPAGSNPGDRAKLHACVHVLASPALCSGEVEVLDWSVSNATLEEVFLKISAAACVAA